MEAKERVIVDLAAESYKEALKLVKKLNPYVGYFKVCPDLRDLRVIKEIQNAGGKVFYDGEFIDSPDKVARLSREATELGVEMFSVHCLGGEEMMEAALRAAHEVVAEPIEVWGEEKMMPLPIILGETVLSNLKFQRLRQMVSFGKPPGNALIQKQSIKNLIADLARLAQKSGLHGVMVPSQEIEVVRGCSSPGFLVVASNIWPVWTIKKQERLITPIEAIKAGADYLVIGGPIIQPPSEIGGPVEVAKRIIEEIETAS